MIFPRAHFNNKSPLSLFSDFLYYLLFSCGWVVVVVSPLKIMLRERNSSVLLQIFRNFLCQGSGRRKKNNLLCGNAISQTSKTQSTSCENTWKISGLRLRNNEATKRIKFKEGQTKLLHRFRNRR